MDINATIDEQARQFLEIEGVEWQPGMVKYVNELPPPECGLVIVPIGRVFNDVFWLAKKAGKAFCVFVTTLGVIDVASWFFYVAGAPHVSEFVEIVKAGDTQKIIEYLPDRKDGYVVIKEQWVDQLPTDQEIQDYVPNLFGHQARIDTVAMTTTAPSPTLPTHPVASASSGPPSGSGVVTARGVIIGAGTNYIPREDRLILVSTTGVSDATVQNTKPIRFGI
jgi:hypothetical protein